MENIAGTGPYGRFRRAETTVGLAIPIELGGKRQARIAVADARTTRAQLAAAIKEADIRLQDTELYIHAVAAERRLTTIGRAHVRTPVTNAPLVFRLLLQKKKKRITQ